MEDYGLDLEAEEQIDLTALIPVSEQETGLETKSEPAQQKPIGDVHCPVRIMAFFAREYPGASDKAKRKFEIFCKELAFKPDPQVASMSRAEIIALSVRYDGVQYDNLSELCKDLNMHTKRLVDDIIAGCAIEVAIQNQRRELLIDSYKHWVKVEGTDNMFTCECGSGKQVTRARAKRSSCCREPGCFKPPVTRFPHKVEDLRHMGFSARILKDYKRYWSVKRGDKEGFMPPKEWISTVKGLKMQGRKRYMLEKHSYQRMLSAKSKSHG